MNRGNTYRGRHRRTSGRWWLRVLRWIVIIVVALTASWWIPRLNPTPEQVPAVVDVVPAAVLFEEPVDPPKIEEPEDDSEIPLPLGPDDLLDFLTDWVATRLAEALSAMAESVSTATLSLRIESLDVMDPADPNGFHGLSFGAARAAMLLLITVGGVWVMTHETLQTRITIKEILPRVVMAFVAMELSVRILSWVIVHANTAVHAILSLGFTEETTGAIAATLTEISDSVSGTDSWLLLTLVIGITVMLTLLLIGVVTRVLLLMLLAITGPLALACHALPATEGVARTWWKALGACVASAVGQALVLVLWMKLFFRDGQRTTNPLAMPDAIASYADMLLVMALLWLMHKALSMPMRKAFSIVGGNPVGQVLRTMLVAKSFGLVGGVGRFAKTAGGGKAATALRRTPTVGTDSGAAGVVSEEPGGGFDGADPDRGRFPGSDIPKGPKPPAGGGGGIGPRTATGWPKAEAQVSTAVVPRGGYAPVYRSGRAYRRPAWHTPGKPFLPPVQRPKPAPGMPPAPLPRHVPIVEREPEPPATDMSTPPREPPSARPRRVRRRNGVRQW